MTPLRTGLALAITVGLFYTLRALIWAVAPGPFLSFMSNRVPRHGLQQHGPAAAVRMAGVLDGAACAVRVGVVCRRVL